MSGAQKRMADSPEMPGAERCGASLDRRAFLAVSALAALQASGAAGVERRLGRGAPRRPAEGVGVAEERVYLIPGRTLVLRLRGAPGGEGAGGIDLRLSDGTRLEATAAAMTVEPARPAPGVPRWLGPAVAWSLATPERAAGGGEGIVWHAAAPVPAESGPGSGDLRVNGRPTSTAWLDAALLDPPREALASPVPAAHRESAALGAMLTDRMADPAERWRALLALGRLHAREARSPSDPIAALAEQVCDRWRIALGRLHAASALDAERVRAVIAGAVVLPPEVTGGEHAVAPAWESDPRAIGALLEGLLAPGLTGERLARHARLWLAVRAESPAWIMDDAGRADPGAPGLPRVLVSLGVANTAASAAIVGARQLGISGRVGDEPLRPMHADVLDVPAVVESVGPAGVAEAAPPLLGRIGEREFELRPMTHVLPATPPGLRIGPLLPDWTMPEWLRPAEDGPPRLPAPDRRTAALLHRGAWHGADGGGAGAEGGARWLLYVECRTPGDEAGAESGAGWEQEFVDVWLGAFRDPAHVLRVRADGRVEVIGGSPAGVPERAEIARDAGRWTALLTLPREIGEIDADGRRVLRIGLTRTDAEGVRTAWPRRLLPWQAEPGRLGVDLSRWDGFE